MELRAVGKEPLSWEASSSSSQKKDVINTVIEKMNGIFVYNIALNYAQLLNETRDINAKYEGWSLLHCCTYQNGYRRQFTPVFNKMFDLMQYLVKNGADVEAQDNLGRTPIYFQSIYKEYLDCLLQAGAQVNPLNPEVMPLHVLASLAGKLVIDLIEKGADVYAIDKYGRMPLHCAAIHCGAHPMYSGKNLRDLVRYAPLSTQHQDNFGNYPLYYAILFGGDYLEEDVYTVEEMLGEPSQDENLVDFLAEYSPSIVIDEVLKKIQEEGFLEPTYEGSEISNYEEEYKIYDDIYNVPAGIKIMLGGGKEKKVKKRKELATNLEAKSNNKKEPYIKEGKTYYLHKDNHGGKHVIGARYYIPATKREFIAKTASRNCPATFYPDFAKNYDYLLKGILIEWIDERGGDPDKKFFEYEEPVGADEGKEINYIELYYGDEIGSHIRPKHRL
jgi:hypothetical protein